MRETIRKANQYIDENREKVDQQYRGAFHLLPPIGWMNDPNGLFISVGNTICFTNSIPMIVFGDLCIGGMLSQKISSIGKNYQ